LNSKEDLINLLNVPQIGPTRLRKLIGTFEKTDGIFDASIKELTKVPGIDEETAISIKKAHKNNFGKKQLELIKKHNVKIITFWDDEFPYNLRRIHDPPVVLFLKGDLVHKDKYAVAIVGTRTPTEYGKIIAEKFAQELSSMGVTVVSGLARGIDSAAHRGALLGGGRTIAVLGTGLDRIYPFENVRLAGKIVDSGAMISEFTIGTGPDRENFPRRNRIISGISLGTLVVEAPKKSGALITALFSLDQGREVFAVPGSIHSPKSSTPHYLIRQGATLVRNVEDIIQEIEPHLKGMQAQLDFEEPKTELDGDEEKMFLLLSKKPLHIDKICEEGAMDSPNALAVLLSLELKGLVKQLPGKMFVRF